MAHRIAIFRALYLGDMLCIIPVVRAVRKAWPESEIYLVGLAWQKDFAARFPMYFDHFLEFPGWPGLPEQPVDTERTRQFLQDISRYRFDLLLQMHGSGDISNTLCMLWDAKKVCGLRRRGGYAPDEAMFPVSEDSEHEILRFMKLLDCLGVPAQGTELEFPIQRNEWSIYKKIEHEAQLSSGEYICIHPGARDPRRRWPVENFAVIANRLAARGKKIVITGSTEESALLADLQGRISGDVLNIVERYGHLSAGELAAVLKHARLLVSNDTGVSHIAAALGVQSVILFSPFSFLERWRPLNTNLHCIVPYEKTNDIAHVQRCIDEQLTRSFTQPTTSVMSA